MLLYFKINLIEKKLNNLGKIKLISKEIQNEKIININISIKYEIIYFVLHN